MSDNKMYVLEFFDDLDSCELVADRECGVFGGVEAAQQEAERLEGMVLEWQPENEYTLPSAYARYPAGYVIRPLLQGVL